MRNGTARMRGRRAATLTSLAAVAVLTATGFASAAYPGVNRVGNITACFSSGGMRIVDHFPCRSGERPLTWNARGRDGAAGPVGAQGPAGADGAAGKTGATGEPGPAGAAGAPGAAGERGADGLAGAAGAAGVAGVQGPTGAAGPAGEIGPVGPAGEMGPAGPTGATGPMGPVGPVGPAGAASSADAYQFGYVANNTGPDCAMSGPTGRTAAGVCDLAALERLGDYLPHSVTIRGFRVVLDRATAVQIDVLARTVAPITNASHDVFLLCSIPAGASSCTQTDGRVLNGPNLFGWQFSGSRAWSYARFGYTLTPA